MRSIKAFTLAELLVAIVILVMAVAGVMSMAVFCVVQVKSQMERADCQTQLNFALEDMKLHFMSAIRVPVMFSSSTTTQTSFTANGEANIYTITPDNAADNADYTYGISTQDPTKGALVRYKNTVLEEVLVEARFKPQIEFSYNAGTAPDFKADPPNFMTVKITAYTKTTPIGLTNEVVRQEGIRFWFIDVVSAN